MEIEIKIKKIFVNIGKLRYNWEEAKFMGREAFYTVKDWLGRDQNAIFISQYK